MNYWLFQVMYDLYPESWNSMIEMQIAAQHYPLSRNWIGAKRNNNALRKLKEGDAIVASFTNHRFAGYGILRSNFYIGGHSLKIMHRYTNEEMEFLERLDCEWTALPLGQDRPYIKCDDIKKQGYDIDMIRGQCVKQIDQGTFKALKLRLDSSGATSGFLALENKKLYINTNTKDVERDEHQYWLWVTRPEYYNSVGSFGGWSCHKDTMKGDLVFLWRAKGKSDIGYLLQVESNAAPDHEWGYSCEYRTLYAFKNPVNIKDLRGDSYFDEWSPLKINLQGKAFKIQENYWRRLNQIAITKDSGYKDIVSKGLSVLVSANTDFTAIEYASAFNDLKITPHYMQMLLANYHASNRTLTASMMAKVMGYDSYGAANLHYGTLGRLIGEKLGWHPLPEFKVNVLVDFEKEDKEWLWIMKPAVAEAIKLLGWDEDASTIPEEIDKPIFEGALKRIPINAYERSTRAREECLLHYGCKCSVCGTNLSDIYGEIAAGRIHVPHLKPLSEINSEYQIDPIADLRPICPNCHYIIHLNAPPYSIEEMREMIKETTAL